GKTSGRWTGEGSKGRVRRRNEIHVKMVGGIIWIRRLAGKPHKSVRSARWRQPRTIEICGQKGIDRSTKRSDWTNEGSRLPGQHLRTVKGEGLRTEVRCARRVENVHAHVIGIGPYTEVRI